MKLTILAVLTVFLIACDAKVKVEEAKISEKKESSKIKNGIVIKEEGVKVEQAFLLDHEGNLVSDKNLTKLNQLLRVRLILGPGFTTKDGKVYLGGSEKVVTSEGDVVLDEKDLFAGTEGLTPENAKIITMSVQLTSVVKLMDYYEVQFRIWDKNSPNAVSGSYRFNIE